MFRKFGLWSFISMLVALLIIAPSLIIFLKLLQPAGATWIHIVRYLLSGYLKNTLLLALGVMCLTGIVGITTSWLVAQFAFPGSRWYSKLLLLPLAFPTYIMAYAYFGICNYLETSQGIIIDIRSLPGLIFVLSAALYPYVYSLCLISFRFQSLSLFEAARTMGRSYWSIFFQVALPMSSGAIAGGMVLVMMELLNDYGAAKHFGVDTLTIGIFRAWHSMSDIGSAVRLCAISVIIVGTMMVLEKVHRGRKQYFLPARDVRQPEYKRLTGFSAWAASLICFLPFFWGFLLPLGQIISWSIVTADLLELTDLIQTTYNSLTLAVFAALLSVVTTIVLSFSKNWELNKLVAFFSKLTTVGYALPGAVIAMGLLVLSVSTEQLIVGNISLLNQTIIILVLAYVIRFNAIAFNTAEAAFRKISPHVTAAARMMSPHSVFALSHVHLPLAGRAVIMAGILVFVEVVKELPLTLILRPFNYNTLATRCFEMAGDERVYESGTYALLIVMAGMLPVFLINHIVKEEI